jgi:hypothetical protein
MDNNILDAVLQHCLNINMAGVTTVLISPRQYYGMTTNWVGNMTAVKTWLARQQHCYENMADTTTGLAQERGWCTTWLIHTSRYCGWYLVVLDWKKIPAWYCTVGTAG